MATKGIIYYSDKDLPIGKIVRDQLETIGLPIVSCTLYPIDFGKNIVLNLERGYLTMFRQILTALENTFCDIVFFCEHDVLYPKEHFDFTPTKDIFYYDHNWWKIGKGNLAVHWDADQVSGICVNRKLAIEFYKNRIETFDPDNFNRSFEPMSRDKSESWWSSVPYIDVRGKWNLTRSKWGLEDFRDKSTAIKFQTTTVDKIPGWNSKQLSDILLMEG